MELSDSDYEPVADDEKYSRFSPNHGHTLQIPTMSHMNPHQSPNNGPGPQLPNTNVSFDLNTGSGGVLPPFSGSGNAPTNKMFPTPDSFGFNNNSLLPDSLSNMASTSRSANPEPSPKYEMNDQSRVEQGAMDMFRYEPESMMESKKESLTDSKLIHPHRMVPMFPFTQSLPEEGAGKDFTKGKESSRDWGKKDAKQRHTQQRRPSDSQEPFKGITASVELREICQLESWKELVQRNKVLYKQGDMSIDDSVEMEEEEEEEENEEPERSQPEIQDSDKKKQVRNAETSWAVNKFSDIKETEGLFMQMKLFTDEDLKNKEMKDLKMALKALSKQEMKVYPYQTIDYPTQISRSTTAKDYLWYSDTSAESDKEGVPNKSVNGEVNTKEVEELNTVINGHPETNIEDELEVDVISEENDEEQAETNQKDITIGTGYDKVVVEVNGMKEYVVRVKNEQETEEEYDLNVELEKVLELNDEPQHLTNIDTEFDADMLNTATQMSLASALDPTKREEDRYKVFGELEEIDRGFDLNDYRYEWYKYRSGLNEKLTISHFIEFDQMMKKKFKIKTKNWKEDEKDEENVGQVQKLYSVAETNLKLLMHYNHPEVSSMVNSQIYDLNSSKVLYTFSNEEEDKTPKDDLVAVLEESTAINSNLSGAGTNREAGASSKEGKDKESKEIKDGKEVAKELEKELEKELGKDEEPLLTGKDSDVRRQWRKRLQGIDKQKRLKLVNQGVSLSCLDNESALESSRNYDFVYEFDEVASMFKTSDYLGILNHSFDAHYAASNPHEVGQEDEVLNKRDLIHTRVARNIVGILPLVGKNAKIQLARFHRLDFRTGMFKMSVTYYTHDIEKDLKRRKYTDKREFKQENWPKTESSRLVSLGTNTLTSQVLDGMLTQNTQSLSGILSQNTQSLSAFLSQNTQSSSSNTVPHTVDGETERSGMEMYRNVEVSGYGSRAGEMHKVEETTANAVTNAYQPTELEGLNATNQIARTSNVHEYGSLGAVYKQTKSSTPPNYWADELEREGAGVEWEVYTVEKSMINMNFREDDIVEGVQNHCSNYFVNSADLSLVDDTKLVLLEYVEKYPLLMNNLGMTSRVDTYINTNAGEGIFKQSHHKREEVLGNVTYAQEYELFGVQHRLKNNETQSILENTLFKAPIFYRTSNPRHYRPLNPRFSDHTGEELTVATNSIYNNINWDNGLVSNNFVLSYDGANADTHPDNYSISNTHENGTTNNTHWDNSSSINNGNTMRDRNVVMDGNTNISTNNTNNTLDNSNINGTPSNSNTIGTSGNNSTKNNDTDNRNSGTDNNDEEKSENEEREGEITNDKMLMYDFLLVRTKLTGIGAEYKNGTMSETNAKAKSTVVPNEAKEIMRIRSLDDNLVLGVVGQCEPKVLIHNPKSKNYMDDNKLLLKAWVIKMAMMYPGIDVKKLKKLARKKFYPLLPDKEISAVLKQIEATPVFSTRPQALENTLQSTIKPEVVCSLESARAQRFRLKSRGITHLKSHDGIASVSTILSQQEVHFASSIAQATKKLNELKKRYYTRMVTLNVDEEIIKEKIRYFNLPINEYTLYGHPPLTSTEMDEDGEIVKASKADGTPARLNANSSRLERIDGVNGSYKNVGTLETIDLDDIKDSDYLDVVDDVTQESQSYGGNSKLEREFVRHAGYERNGVEMNSEDKNATVLKAEKEREKSIKSRKLKMEELRRNRGNMSSKVEYIEKELKLSNWNITHDVKMVLKGSGQFSLHGLGDPSNSGLAVSLIKRQVNTGASASTTGNVYNMSVVGQSNEDLRKLSMDELSKRLQLYGVSDAIIKTLPRWDQVALVRQYRDGYGAAKNVDDPLNKFRIPPQEYKNQLTKIIQKQKEALTQPSTHSPLSLNSRNSLSAVMRIDEESDKKSDKESRPEGEVVDQKEGFGNDEPYDELEKEREELKLLKESLNLKKKIEDVIEDEKLIPVPGLMWLRQSRKTPSEPFGNERAVFVYGEKNIAKVLEWRSQCAKRKKTQIPSETVFGVNIGKRVCRNCGQPGHIASNPKCPLYTGDKQKHDQSYLKQQQQKKQEVEQDSSEDGLITSKVAVMRNTKEYIKNNMVTSKVADSDTEVSDLPMFSGDSASQLGQEAKHKTAATGPPATSRRRRGSEDVKDHGESSKLSTVDMKIIAKILGTVEKEARYRPFVARVPEAIAPNYYELIQRPMWLSLLKSRVRSKDYGSVEDLVKDIFLLEINCKMYNSEHSQNAWLRGVSQTLVDDLSNRIRNHVQNKGLCKVIDRLLAEHKSVYRGDQKTQHGRQQKQEGQQDAAPVVGQQDQMKNLEKLNELVKLVEQGKPIELEHLKELKQMMQKAQQAQSGQHGQPHQSHLDAGTQISHRTDVNIGSQFSMDSQLSSSSQYTSMGQPGMGGMTDIGNIATMGSMDTVSGSRKQSGLGAMGTISGMSQTGIASIDPLNPMTGVMGSMVGVGAMANMGTMNTMQNLMGMQDVASYAGMDQQNLINMADPIADIAQYTGAFANYNSLNIFDGDMSQYDTNMGQYTPGVGGYDGTYEQFAAEMGQFGGDMDPEYVLKDNEEMMKMQMSEYGNMGVNTEINYGMGEDMASGAAENTAESVLGAEERAGSVADNSVSVSADNSEMSSIVNDQDDNSAVEGKTENKR
ncbi:hypothetical protein MACJ_000260 [Theileria orientalis]|uniref:Bromo domain-containing protein n=1 Tax=Theileria orientalis TaxID=68886 RepID=A0A976M3T3_THEOR|nr:hypothetical protein MACJ_000260 [Theileria orientalis]